jgi:potassium efflux system protein
MHQVLKFAAVVVLSGAGTLFPAGMFAQDSEPPAVNQVTSPSSEDLAKQLRLKVESALTAIGADSALEESTKDLLRAKYQETIEALTASTADADKAAEYRDSMTTAPDSAAKLRAQLKDLPSVQSARIIKAPANPDDLQQELDVQRAALAALDEQLSNVKADPNVAEQRPAEIAERIPAAERELADVRKLLASPGPPEDDPASDLVADRFLLQARELRLLSELEMLEQDQLSQSVRRNLQQVQEELLTRQVENATESVAAYQSLMNKRDSEAAQKIVTRAEESKLEVPQDDQEAVELAAEVSDLGIQLENVIQDQQKISTAKVDATSRLTRLNQRYESIKKQLELNQRGDEMARVLIELRALLYKRGQEVVEMNQWPTLAEARLDAVQVDFKIENQSDVQKRFADRPVQAIQDLIVAREEVLDKLHKQYLNMIPTLASLESDSNLYLDTAREIRSDMTGQLFWIRSSPTLSVSTLEELPSGLSWVFSRKHWSEVWGAVKSAMGQSPTTFGGLLLFAVVLLIMRFRIGAALRNTGKGVRRVSTDRFGLTLQAVFWTALLALPIPLLAGFLTAAMAQAVSPSAWLGDINHGMPLFLLGVSAASATIACCYPGGLAAAHFGWRKEQMFWLRTGSLWLAFVYCPIMLLAYSTLSSESGRFLYSFGRVAFLFAQASILIVLAGIFCLNVSVRESLFRKNGNQPVTRLQYACLILLIGCPLGLMAFAFFGYTMTAINLGMELVFTLIIIVAGTILYSLALRWFKVEFRKLALSEAMERRRALQEAAASEEDESGELISIDEDVQELDLVSVGEQTRYLLRLLFGMGIAAAVLSIWSNTLPLIPYMDTIRLPLTEDFSLLDLVKATLVVGVTWLITKNLPGMLELTVLRTTSIDTGTRHAIATISQYAVLATGFVLLFNVIDLDWAKFGWIAGGLSVGIGFGMQEVVANFVCGLILLVERPIRIGDVVTVDGMMGTVTKIQMRAITITNFDRQDLVVPNKTLITGNILNWTLSASLNRIMIPVGVAYGSDTKIARQILVDVATDHPRVLDDPAPMASFEQFADSSLNLVLRAYLPDLENRIGTITELHTEIDKRFAAAGIEIAFPQQDIHIRNGSENLPFNANEELLPGNQGSERSVAK